jgi:aminoglycoside phosphotransferase (APT) family kinase protein
VSSAAPKRGVADVEDVRRRADAAVSAVWADASVLELRPLPGGTSSLTYVADVRGGPHAHLVVKMAPPGLAPVRNRDVLRQARVLQALAAVPDVKVPAVFAGDAGDPPDVPPLFVMGFVDGESYEPLHAIAADLIGQPPTDAEVDARAEEAVRMLAILQKQEPASIGLADEPATSLAEEVARWETAFASCELPDAAAATERECRDRLVGRLPAAAPPVILHGDWRLGNMQCAGPAVNAVIDWEIWSVGDPRIDLAWMMLMAHPDHPSVRNRDAHMPSPETLLEWYESAAGDRVVDLDWAQALVRYKQSAASALLVKNALKRGESGQLVDRMNAGIGALLQWALDYLP